MQLLPDLTRNDYKGTMSERDGALNYCGRCMCPAYSTHFFQHLTNLNLHEYWNPCLIVQNLLKHTTKKKWQELSFTPRGEAFIVEKRRITGEFSEKLELKEFPFDHQVIVQWNLSWFHMITGTFVVIQWNIWTVWSSNNYVVDPLIPLDH